MKNYKFLVPIVLVLLFAVGIYMKYDKNVTIQKQYDTYLTQARKYVEKGIPKDAEANYLEAVKIKPSIDLYLEVGEFYKTVSINSAIAWGEKFVEVYPEDTQGYEYALEIYKDMQYYEMFYELYSTVRQRGIVNETIANMESMICNAFYLEGSYEDVGIFSNGYCPVMKKELWKYVTASGGSITGYNFTEAGQFLGDIAPITNQLGEKYLIDSSGEKKQVYENIEKIVQVGTYFEGVCTIFNGDKWDFYTLEGELLHGGYDGATIYANGLSSVKESDKWYLVDDEGNKVSEKAYDSIVRDEKDVITRNSRLFVEENGKFYMIDMEGNRVVTTAFDDARLFNNDTYAAVNVSGKWGFVDAEGNMVIDAQYEDARSFSNGYAAVKKDNKWGYIDLENNVFIDFQFDQAKEFTERGTAFVKIGDEWRLLLLYSHN